MEGYVFDLTELSTKQSLSMPGTVIKQAREMRNYSQEYVAKQMNISQNAYSKIENNITQLTVTHVKQLSEIFDMPVVDLLKDNFEIRKPHHLHDEDLFRKDVLFLLHDIQHNIKLKQADKHQLYAVIHTLLQTVQTISEDID